MVIFDKDVMPIHCSGCAYTDGTEANGDAVTTTTRQLCEMGGGTFYCHANAVDDVLPEAKRVCRGFADVRLTQVITGKEPPRWKKILAQEGLNAMEDVIAGDASLDDESGEKMAARLIERTKQRLAGR